MNARTWFRNCIALILIIAVLFSAMVVFLDPFLHYHAPLDGFYYVLDEQRMQNDGIIRQLDYDAIITGTSMTENFKTSEMDALFGTSSIKVPFAGATYKEVNDNLEVAFATHSNIRIVVRGLDLSLLDKDANALRDDMGDYPLYLYNDNPVDDIKYLLNRDAIGRYCGMMVLRKLRGHAGGMTSFDEYSYTGEMNVYAPDYALQWDYTFSEPAKEVPVTQEDIERTRENIRQNVCALAKQHPETLFYYFIPPYNMAYWGTERENGTLERSLFLHRMLIEEMIAVDNIRLFAFGTRTEITADLSKYHDLGHYSPDVNTWILQRMAWGTKEDGLITGENAEAYLTQFETLVRTYNYDELLEQVREFM